MSLADIQLQGSNATVARSYAEGATAEEILELLRREYKDQTEATYNAALREGLAAAGAVHLWEVDPSGEDLTPGVVPSGGGYRRGYRFYVNTSLFDPETEVAFGRPIEVEFDHIPTADEVDQAARAMVEKMYTGTEEELPTKSNLGELEFESFSVVAIERAS